MLEAVGQGGTVLRLPERWTEAPYEVPPITGMEPRFRYTGLDARQLAEALEGAPSLWDHFAAGANVQRRPLTAMRPWHLALGLAAGPRSVNQTYFENGNRLKNRECDLMNATVVGPNQPNQPFLKNLLGEA